jgi:predicted transcriptional regulator
MAPSKSVRYTTILKFLQIMTEKAIVKRAEDGKRHVYRSALSKERVQRDMLRDLAETAFQGSLADLVKCASRMKKRPGR